MELVYIILKGITKFNKQERRDLKSVNSRRRSTKILRRIDSSKFKLEKIKIKNPKIWDVLKMDDIKE